VLGLYSFVLQLPDDGTPVPKHVGVLIIIINCILFIALVGECIDYPRVTLSSIGKVALTLRL
jgi:hypothetical protein